MLEKSKAKPKKLVPASRSKTDISQLSLKVNKLAKKSPPGSKTRRFSKNNTSSDLSLRKLSITQKSSKINDDNKPHPAKDTTPHWNNKLKHSYPFPIPDLNKLPGDLNQRLIELRKAQEETYNNELKQARERKAAKEKKLKDDKEKSPK